MSHVSMYVLEAPVLNIQIFSTFTVIRIYQYYVNPIFVCLCGTMEKNMVL